VRSSPFPADDDETRFLALLIGGENMSSLAGATEGAALQEERLDDAVVGMLGLPLLEPNSVDAEVPQQLVRLDLRPRPSLSDAHHAEPSALGGGVRGTSCSSDTRRPKVEESQLPREHPERS